MRFFSIIKKIGSTIILSLFIFSIFGTLAYAQATKPTAGPDCTKEYCALTTIPGAFDACKADKNGVVTCDKGTVKNPVTVIKNIYGISIGIGAMLAIVMIIWAGIQYATTEAITGKSDAKEKWQGAVFGLILLLASYIILRTINVDLVNINLDLGKPIKCTPIKGPDGKDIPCGVDADALGQITKNIAKFANKDIEAEKQAIASQKLLDNLKVEREKMDIELKKHENDAAYFNTPEGKVFEKKRNDLDNSIRAAETSNIKLEISNVLTKADLAVVKAVQTNDLESATKEITSAINVTNQTIIEQSKLTDPQTQETLKTLMSDKFYLSSLKDLTSMTNGSIVGFVSGPSDCYNARNAMENIRYKSVSAINTLQKANRSDLANQMNEQTNTLINKINISSQNAGCQVGAKINPI